MLKGGNKMTAQEPIWDKLKSMEKSIRVLEQEMHEREKVDIVVQNELNNLNESLNSFKTEMSGIMLKQNERVWGLIKSFTIVIIILILFILTVVGVEIGPQVLKLLGGV